jgi:hypothetical protein
MATQEILQYFRSKEPRFADVPDDQLIYFVGSKKKAFLQDEEFKKSYQDVLRGQMEVFQTPEGRQQVATEAGVEDLTTTEKAISSFQAGAKMLASNLALTGARVSDRVRSSSFGGFLARTPGIGDFINVFTIDAPEAVAETMAEEAKQVREVRDVLPPTQLQSIVNIVAEAAPSVGPALVAGPIGGLPATVGAAAVTSYGAVLSDAEQDLRDRGYSESDVRDFAHAEATVAGLATGLITGGFNKFAPGVEKLAARAFRNPATVVTQSGQTAGQFKGFIVDTLKGFGSEASEEALDETAQSLLEMYVRNPEMSALEVVKRAGVAGLAGGVLGGGAAAVTSISTPSTTPQTDAAVQEAEPIPVAREEADVITGGRTEEEILATAPELPPELQIRQQELEARRQEVESTRAELLEVATRATSEVSAEAIQEAQDLDLEVEGLESEVSQLQSQAEAEPSAEATLALETKQKELDSKRQQVEARRSELLEGVTRTTSDRVSTLIQEAQDLDLELDALTTEVQQLQTQAEAEPTTEATAALESKQQELETKRQQVQSKEVELVDVAKQASEQNLKEDNPSLLETPTSELETDIKPNTDSIVSLGVVGGPMGPATLLPDGKRLKFNPEELVQSWPGRLIQKFRQVLTDGTTAPSEFVEIKGKSKARRDSFVKLSKRYADNINTLANAKAKADGVSKDDVLAQANQYLLGKKAQMKREDMNLLTDKMIDELKKARNLIDALSTRVLDFGFLEGNLAKSIKQNLGSYLLRSYKVFDPAMDWAKNVPFEVKERAIEYLTREIKRKEGRPDQESLSREEASMIVEEILTKPDQTTEWILGKTNVGGIPVSSFLKRKQIPKEIRDLMGEIRDPLQNIVKSTHRVADIVVAFEAQEAIAELGLEVGLFSKEKTKDKLFKLFEDTDSKLAVKYPSLGGLYASKPVVEAMQEFYGAKGNSHVALKTLFSGLAKATSVGKFSQVILNIQDSFMVNLLGAAMVEFANGRISIMPNLTTKAASGLATNVWRKFKGDQTRATTKTPTTEELEQIASQTGKQFIENWNQYLNDPVLTETLTSQYGALDENIVVKDLIGAWVTEEQVGRLSTLDKLAFRAMPEWVRRKVFGKLGNIYSWPDNAMKVNAFFQEALDYANAYPDRSMRDIFRTAGDIARATTPVYSKVPRGLKQLNLVGVIPTYISFIYEMHRNVFNSIIIAKNEINSSNAKIKAKGAKRMVFSLGVLALSAKGMEGIIDLVRNYFTDSDELDEQGQKDLEWLMAPWDRPQQNGVLNFKAGEEFTYANLSYQVPQAVLTAPFVAAFKGEDGADAFNKWFATLMNTWFGGSVLPSTLGEVYYNKKDGGGEIYNESLPLLERVPSSLEHIAKNVFMPGFIRKIDRMQKAWDESENSYGRVYSMGEETMRLFSLRPTTYNIPEASRFRMQQFNRDYSTASRFTSRVKAEKLTPEEAKEQQAKEDELINKVKDDYAKFIQAMLRLGVPKATLRKNERDLFKAESGERRSSLYKDLRSTSAPFLR